MCTQNPVYGSVQSELCKTQVLWLKWEAQVEGGTEGRECREVLQTANQTNYALKQHAEIL